MLVPCLIALAALVATPGVDPVCSDGVTPLALEREISPRVAAPFPVPWTPGHKDPTDWAAIIDATWGPGHHPTVQTNVFLTFWNEVDREFACFHDIDDVWQEQFDLYLPEIVPGVSRGRLAGILGQMSLTLREGHTRAYDVLVGSTFAGRGVPLLYSYPLGYRAGDLGAAVTALEDGTGLVYRVLPDNPLGLEPGDVILGYDGRPWSECLEELLTAALPMTGGWGSAPSSWDHLWAGAVGANWHLFDTMDVRKYASGETVHLATAVIDGFVGDLYASDQLDVGIPFPDIGQDETVTWGVIERDGEQIGYIYVFGWAYTAGTDFAAAVDDLTTNYDTAGLIIDFRKNYGGNMFLSDSALGLLFAEDTPTIEWFVRCSITEHLPLCNEHVWQGYVIDADPVDRYYDRPIAVLTGPGAASSGDQVALRMTYHPQARVFGRSTNAAFNAPEFSSVDDDFRVINAIADCARLDDLDTPLTHREFPVDEAVWLTVDDVAQGLDTVVEAAAAWILNPTAVDDPSLPPGPDMPRIATRFLGARPNPFNPTTELTFRLARPSDGELVVYDLAGRRVRTFSLGGLGPGEHRIAWDGRSDAGVRQSSGSYVVQLRTEERVDGGRATLVK